MMSSSYRIKRASAPRGAVLDLIALGSIVMIGLVLRLLFGPQAPVLLMGDSETYLGPALDLARGTGFDLATKRTPGYPLLLAATLSVSGEDLRAAAAAQHLLGVATGALAYLLARRLAGLTAAVLAGLSTVLAGNLLIYERMIMSEALFTTLLTAAVACLAVAFRSTEERGSGPSAAPVPRYRWIWLVVFGLVLGAATLVRPVAQPLLLLAPIALLLARAPLRTLVAGSLLAGLAYAFVLASWALPGILAGDAPSVGSVGQSLVGRTARHDRRNPSSDTGFIFYEAERDYPNDDSTRLAVRQSLQEAANRGSSGRAVHTRLRRELGLSGAEADRLMRDLAIEAILARPGYYLSGTLQRFARLWTASPERLSSTWNDQTNVRDQWEDVESAELWRKLPTPSPGEIAHTEPIAGLFQAGRLGWVFPMLFGLGLLAAIAASKHRLAILPATAALILTAVSVAMVGGVTRYRYPTDPLSFVVMAVGLTWSLGHLPRARRVARGE